jgi:hypothetical protein
MHSINLQASGPPSKPASHDPDVCGIMPEWDCDACRAARERDRRDQRDHDAEARDRWQRRHTARRFFCATGITLAELASTLLHLQADSIAEIVGAVIDGREAAA